MQEAIAALRAGERDRAFALLRQHLMAYPKDANGWLWMSEVAPELPQQIDALQRVLLLAPDHPRTGAIRLRLRELHESTQPQPAILKTPPPESATFAAAAPQPSRSLNDIDTLLARIRGELAAQTVAEPEARTSEVTAVRAATAVATPQPDAQAWLKRADDAPTATWPATLAPFAGAERAEQYSVAVEPHPLAEPQRSARMYEASPASDAPTVETAQEPGPTVGARRGGPLPRWAWGVLLFLILVLLAAVFVAMSARGLL